MLNCILFILRSTIIYDVQRKHLTIIQRKFTSKFCGCPLFLEIWLPLLSSLDNILSAPMSAYFMKIRKPKLKREDIDPWPSGIMQPTGLPGAAHDSNFQTEIYIKRFKILFPKYFKAMQ